MTGCPVSNLPAAITKLFEKHRIVFWYDAKKELRQQFEELWLPGVEKLEIEGQEFWLKHHILRGKPGQKFLLYHEGPQPPDERNWLLDVLLGQGEFRADQVSLWLSELGLDPGWWEFVEAHQSFFRDAQRRKKLHAFIQAAEPLLRQMEPLMLSICIDSLTVAPLETILIALLDEYAREDEAIYRQIQTYGLEDYVWMQTRKELGYHSTQLSVKDFAISLFKACYALELNQPAEMKAEALSFLRRWKDSVRFHASFETLSQTSAAVLGIENDLQPRSIEELAEIDLFDLVDQRILSELVRQVSSHTLSAGDTGNIVWRRRKSHWYVLYEHLYETIHAASQFFSLLGQAKFEVSSLQEGARQYIQNWHQLDRLYRKCVYHARAASRINLLGSLMEQLENQYTNRSLLAMNDHWQQQVNALETWEIPGLPLQRHFYETHVKPFVQQNVRLVVIISDALRYEIAVELAERIGGLKGYQAGVEGMLGMLPSYTQLGMAALLPNQSLEIKPDGAVFVDGQPSAGIENRTKILHHALDGAATALKAENLAAMNREELRELFRSHGLIYVYHNQIDATGDKRESEQRVFSAVEETLEELIALSKKIANANTSHILITADHGFIYQDRAIDESEFAGVDVSGEGVTYKNRRFVLGRQLPEGPSVKKFRPEQLGLDGDVDILIPKSINRLRLQGAGSRFVHGGNALQEIILPVVNVHKVEGKESAQVNVEIIRGSTSLITSGQLSVTFYQAEPVGSNMQPRVLRAGIYAQAGVLLSEQKELVFDFTAENAGEREVKVRFLLNKEAEAFNNQVVELRLEEQAAGTSHYALYKAQPYTLKKSFTADFDL